MQRFICPECAAETELTPRYGDEVVSVYCLAHQSGADRHVYPVRMTEVRIAAALPAPELEPVPA